MIISSVQTITQTSLQLDDLESLFSKTKESNPHVIFGISYEEDSETTSIKNLKNLCSMS